MRVVLYTGKGGVGKTSVAAATAIRCAELGHRTLCVSTDAAHSLGDSLDFALGPEPRRVSENLWAQEVDALHEMEENWLRVQDYLQTLLTWQKLDSISVEELTMFPGMEEMFNLLEIWRHKESKDYDVVVVDAAPTGETLRLLSYPNIVQWWMERVFPIQRRFIGIIRSVAQPLIPFPLPGQEVFDSVENIFHQLFDMQKLLTDPQQTSVRLVINPEKMVIREAQRSFTYLNLFGFHVDAVVVNRLIPRGSSDDYFRAWRESQEKYYSAIEEAFDPLPIFRVPLFEQEVVGHDQLTRLAEVCFADTDPSGLLYQGKAQTLTREGDRYVLSIPLPFTEKQDVSLSQKGEELIVRLGLYKRNIILPRTLAGCVAIGASLDEGTLKIKLDPGKGREPPGVPGVPGASGRPGVPGAPGTAASKNWRRP